MPTPQLSAEFRRRLQELVADSTPPPGTLVQTLRSLSQEGGAGVFAATLEVLARLNVSELRAEQLLAGLDSHRIGLAYSLGRDPGLHVAALDYLSNVTGLISSPAIVEGADLEKAEHSAITDPLTGLANRRRLAGAIDMELRRSRRYGLELALLLLDIDGFKPVNDRHGHIVGDRVLERLGTILRRTVREADLACRIGGDEFAVLLPESDRLGALASGERIRQRTERSFGSKPVNGLTVTIGLSGGIACAPQDAVNAERLMACADRALYVAKREGKGRITIHHSERRGAIRFPFSAHVDARLEVPGAGDGRSARPIDLSATGALVQIESEVLDHGPVSLVFGAPAEDRYPISGRVVRVASAATEVGTVRVGIAFDRPLAETRVWQHVRRSRSARMGPPGGRG